MGYALAALVAVAVLLGTHALALAALTALLAHLPAGAAGGPLETPCATGSSADLQVFRVQHLVVLRAEPVGLLALSTASSLQGALLLTGYGTAVLVGLGAPGARRGGLNVPGAGQVGPEERRAPAAVPGCSSGAMRSQRAIWQPSVRSNRADT
ncbi:hypothetical protein GTR00_07860, partial [Kineococcus sp. T90]